MIRAIGLATVGLATGAAAGWLILRAGSEPSADGIQLPNRVAASSAAYQASLSALEDTGDEPRGIADEIERLAGSRSDPASTLALRAQLTQLALLEPQQAAALAERLNLDPALVGVVYRSWAGVDPEGALAALYSVDPAASRRAAALAMLDVLGLDNAGVDRIALALDSQDSLNFRIDAIARLAERDFAAAFAAATDDNLPQAVQVRALLRLGQDMGLVDPRRAIEQAASIESEPVRTRYLSSVLDAWAQRSPEDLLEYLGSSSLENLQLNADSFRTLAASDPERLLDVSNRLESQAQMAAVDAAIAVLAPIDPAATFTRIRAMGLGTNEYNRVRAIGEAFVAKDPEAAIAWVTSLNPRSTAALNGVLKRVAVTDPVRTAEAIIQELFDPVASGSLDMPSILVLLQPALRPGGSSTAQLAEVASTLAAVNDPRVRLQLNELFTTWPQVDANSAYEWAMLNPGALNEASVQTLAEQLGARDPDKVRQGLARLPSALQPAWARGAAGAMAQADFNGTLQWIDQFRGSEAYPAALDATLNGGMRTDPEAVARYVAADPALRERMAPQIAGVWAARDMPAARRWTETLPGGSERDQAAQSLLVASVNRGGFDAELLNLMSSAQARQNAIMSSLPMLARTDPELGRRLVEEHLRDPVAREQAIQLLDSPPIESNTIMGTPGGTVPGRIMLR